MALRLIFSFRSLRWMSESTDILQRSTEPETTSIKLSMPKPTREMLPASAPTMTATSPSTLFHAIVKYSMCFPRRAAASRFSAAVCIARAYQSDSVDLVSSLVLLNLEIEKVVDSIQRVPIFRHDSYPAARWQFLKRICDIGFSIRHLGNAGKNFAVDEH